LIDGCSFQDVDFDVRFSRKEPNNKTSTCHGLCSLENSLLENHG
jgi:hypothetical protein